MSERDPMGQETGYDEPFLDEDTGPGGGHRRGRGGKGCLAALLALVVLAAGFWFALTKGVDWVSEQFDGAEDYPGPGTGEVMFEVVSGDTTAQIGRNLKAEGVVASVQAFLDAAATEPKAGSIQVGVYGMKEEMRAADALAVLIDPKNQVKSTVTVVEGLRVSDIISSLAKDTDWSVKKWNAALKKDIGLPDYAEGNPEGYLFPATYDIRPDMKPVDVLKAMVARWRQAADDADLEARAAELGKSPAEVMVIASLVEAEGRGDDMAKVSRVIYNRLDGPGDKGGTHGLLGIDASVAYGLGLSPGSTEMTEEQLQQVTPYNTRKVPGLPPTPIEAPGADAIEAALNPAEGSWYYYVTVNLATGETKFYEDYDGFLEGRAEYKQYCETSDRC